MSEIEEIYKSKCTPLSCLPTIITPELSTFSEVKAMIFDIYGTLFISGSGDIGIARESQKEEAIRAILLKHFQLNITTLESLTEKLLALIKREHGIATKNGIPYPEVEIRDLWNEILSPYKTFTREEIELIITHYEAEVNTLWPMPNLELTLEALHAKRLKLGVISNAQFYTPPIFKSFLGKSLEELNFHPALCLYSYQERHAKPGLFLYEKMKTQLAALNITPAETLYVGNDMKNDISPAHEVGFKTVLFAGDARSLRLREEMDLPKPDATVTNLSQILELL